MDKDIQRKQIHGELQAQFEVKLREVKRQKSQLEEELESTSEKWRSERRKLNSEIDRLEASLIEAQALRRDRAVSVLEMEQIQAAADEKIRVASKAWDTQRGHLQTEISRLEQAVTDTLERTNNPLRATVDIRLRLQAQLEEALKIQRRVEDEFLNARESWDKEKLQLTGEIIKTRRGAVTPLQGKLEDGGRIAELESRLSEASRERDATKRDLEKKQGDWQSERQQLVTELALVQQTQLQEKGHTAGLEQQLNDASNSRDAFERELNSARTDWQSERQQLVTELALVRDQAQHTQLQRNDHAADLEQQLSDVSNSRDSFERELSNARSDWQSERQQLVTELAEVQGQAQHTQLQRNDHAAELEQQLSDISNSRDSFERELSNARTDWQSERQQLVTELAQVQGQAQHTQLQNDHAADLEQRLKDASNSRDSFERELNEARSDWQSERQQIEIRINENATYGEQLREAMQERNVLQCEVESARESIRAIRNEHSEERRRVDAQAGETATRLEGSNEEKAELEARVGALTVRIQQLEGQLDETQKAVNPELVEQLRRQYDERLEEMIGEKTQLTEDLKNAQSLLETENNRSAVSSTTTERLNAELARVEARIADLARIIDDPNTELSTVIRKNVERVELDAYLTGILFSMGGNDGL